MKLFYPVYQVLIALLSFVMPWVFRSVREIDPERCKERWGYPSRERPHHPVIWIHASGIGESLSILSLIPKLHTLCHHTPILLTTYTSTAARILENRTPDYVLHQYIPFDHRPYIKRFLDYWKPSIVFLVESDIWPNLLSELERRDIPIAILNGRISMKSYKLWRLFDSRRLFSRFAVCLTHNEIQAERWRRLGVLDVRVIGNLKYSTKPLPANPSELTALQSACQGRSVWLVASSHHREERSVLRIHQALAQDYPNLLTIIVPRHPERSHRIHQLSQSIDLSSVQRSNGKLPTLSESIYIADTIGEMGLFYRLASIVFMGGSLYPYGGHNLIEPAQLHCAIVTGPYMTNFSAILEPLLAIKGILQASDESGVLRQVHRLLRSPEECKTLATNAYTFTAQQKNNLEQYLEAVHPLCIQAGLSPTVLPDTIRR